MPTGREQLAGGSGAIGACAAVTSSACSPKLTGIDELMPDPAWTVAVSTRRSAAATSIPHLTSRRTTRRTWHRRVKCLIYLTKGWQRNWEATSSRGIAR